MARRAALIVATGVSGAGKSTLAATIAQRLGITRLDADDFHPAENRQRMAAGMPLSDKDREPWMARICSRLDEAAAGNESVVLAHSGLRRRHREQLRQRGLTTVFLHLDATRELLRERLSARKNHFMPATLLDSQFEALEPPVDEPDIVTVDASSSVDEQWTFIAAELASRQLFREAL